jgi:CrcB protein
MVIGLHCRFTLNVLMVTQRHYPKKIVSVLDRRATLRYIRSDTSKHRTGPVAMIHLLSIGIGGFCGAICRFLVSGRVHELAGTAMPWGTLAVNFCGSFLLGFIIPLPAGQWFTPQVKAATTVGFLGAFTTFSTFSVDTLELLQREAWLRAAGNITMNVVSCLAAAAAGFFLCRWLHGA